MRAVRLTIAIVFGISAMLVVSAPARAGGPTSVLLSAAGSNAVGLYYDDAEYEELGELVRADEPADSGSPEKNRRRYPDEPFVTVSWLIHDVQVWRVDRIFYESGSEPWIYTVDNLHNPGHGRWHRSTDPEALVDLLERLHLTGGEYPGPMVPPEFADEPTLAGVSTVVPSSEDSDESASDHASTGADESHAATTSEDDGWWWAGGGVAAGVIAGAGAVVIYPRIRHARPKRQQLVDY